MKKLSLRIFFLTTTNPDNFYYALQKTLLEYKMGDYQSAVSSGKALLKRDSTHTALLSIVGNSYNKAGIQDSALIYYDIILRKNPLDESTFSKKAEILFTKKQPEKVVEIARDFMQQDTINTLINSIYGLSLHLCERYDESIDIFLKQQRLGDDSYPTNYYLGLNYFMLNKKFNAEPYFAKAYQMDYSSITTPHQRLGKVINSTKLKDCLTKPSQ